MMSMKEEHRSEQVRCVPAVAMITQDDVMMN